MAAKRRNRQPRAACQQALRTAPRARHLAAPQTTGRELGQLNLLAAPRNMADKPYNVLFLCTGNSARSILAESVLNRLGNGKFRGFSAGSFPKGEVHAYALELLERQNYPTKHLRSKSWDEFA